MSSQGDAKIKHHTFESEQALKSITRLKWADKKLDKNVHHWTNACKMFL